MTLKNNSKSTINDTIRTKLIFNMPNKVLYIETDEIYEATQQALTAANLLMDTWGSGNNKTPCLMPLREGEKYEDFAEKSKKLGVEVLEGSIPEKTLERMSFEIRLIAKTLLSKTDPEPNPHEGLAWDHFGPEGAP